MNSLVSTITFLIVVCVVCTSLLFGYLQVTQFRALAEQGAEALVSETAKSNARAFERRLSQIARDGERLAGGAAVQTVFSAQDPDAVREQDILDDQAARDLTARVFASFMADRPEYAQVRLIGAEGNWLEMVRVNRSPEGLKTVARDQLQTKGDEPYLAHIEKVAAGSRYFSDITLNREHGVVEGPPMIRLVAPIHSDRGDLIGAIVINVDATMLFADTLISNGSLVTVVTQNGDHITMGPDVLAPELVLREMADWSPDRFTATPTNDVFTITQNHAFYAEELVMDGLSEPTTFRIITHLSAEDVNAPIRSLAQKELAISIGLTLVFGTLAYLLAKRLMQPLRRLSDTIQTEVGREKLVAEPVRGNDEVATLTKSIIIMQQQISVQNRKLRALFFGAASPIIVVDRDSRITEINKAACLAFGYDEHELIGQSLGCLMEPGTAKSHEALVENIAAKFADMHHHSDIWGKTKNGGSILLDVSMAVVPTDEGDRIIGIMTDVTMRKTAEAELERTILELERSNVELERSNADLDQFAHVASHDLRAPLRVIDNASTWLAEDLEEHLTEDTRETLNLLQTRVRRMSKLLDDLLQHARIGRVDTPGNMLSGKDLDRILHEISDLPAGMVLDVICPDPKFDLPRAPAIAVLSNLIENAIKHHDKDTGRVKLTFDNHPDAVKIVVSDDGPGIHPDYHAKVFDMFQTLKARDDVEASGMGLAIVRKHIQSQGGSIDLSSDGQHGTKFTIFWPHPPALSHAV